MSLLFEWSRSKARGNAKKHGVSFDEACTAFSDVMSLTIPDPLHSEDEDRFALLGCSCRNRLLVVVHTHRGDRIRIISARPATKRERRQYEETTE